MESALEERDASSTEQHTQTCSTVKPVTANYTDMGNLPHPPIRLECSAV
jgi:hypothetical protein